jgi:putative phosphoribosyl transferase
MDKFLDGTWKMQPGGRFLNRYDAGRGIAASIKGQISDLTGNGVVIGLPRGGVEVAAAVANDLKLPLDFRAVRKVGHPFQPEFAIGAVDISGISIRNPFLSPGEMPPDDEFDRMVAKALKDAQSLEKELRGDGQSPAKTAEWVIVVDDGAATGLTILAAVKGLKSEGKFVFVALPVASDQAGHMLSDAADRYYSMMTPYYFGAVGQFYEDFSQVETEEAKKYLR